MEVITYNTQDTEKLAKQIAEKLEIGAVIALYGELGSGKTTFTRYLVSALGIPARVQSPTFVLARKYQHVNHLDLYRIRSVEELEDLGLNDLLHDHESISIVEWPELVQNMLPDDTISIYFETIDDTTRKITIHNLY